MINRSICIIQGWDEGCLKRTNRTQVRVFRHHMHSTTLFLCSLSTMSQCSLRFQIESAVARLVPSAHLMYLVSVESPEDTRINSLHVGMSFHWHITYLHTPVAIFLFFFCLFSLSLAHVSSFFPSQSTSE